MQRNIYRIDDQGVIHYFICRGEDRCNAKAVLSQYVSVDEVRMQLDHWHNANVNQYTPHTIEVGITNAVIEGGESGWFFTYTDVELAQHDARMDEYEKDPSKFTY